MENELNVSDPMGQRLTFSLRLNSWRGRCRERESHWTSKKLESSAEYVALPYFFGVVVCFIISPSPVVGAAHDPATQAELPWPSGPVENPLRIDPEGHPKVAGDPGDLGNHTERGFLLVSLW